MATTTNHHVEHLSKDLQDILDEFPNFKHMQEKNRIQDALTGHEMPCKLEAIQSYMKGKKFKKMFQKRMYDFQKYKDHIIPSFKRNREHQMFCTLTLRHMNNSPHHIEKHINGQRFKRAFKRWEECQKNGTTFRPNAGRQQQVDAADEDDDENDDDNEAEDEDDDNNKDDSDKDSLSDLYPNKDFTEIADGNDEDSEESASDFEFEEMETDSNKTKIQKKKSPTLPSTATGKRKLEVQKSTKGKQKKLKSKC